MSPARCERIGLSFSCTLRLRWAWPGMMKVRPMYWVFWNPVEYLSSGKAMQLRTS
jgi:hypothetical protein